MQGQSRSFSVLLIFSLAICAAASLSLLDNHFDNREEHLCALNLDRDRDANPLAQPQLNRFQRRRRILHSLIHAYDKRVDFCQIGFDRCPLFHGQGHTAFRQDWRAVLLESRRTFANVQVSIVLEKLDG